MGVIRIVIDTNVITSALMSKKGYSYRLLSIIDDVRFKPYISTPLIFELEDVVQRNKRKIKLNQNEIDDILDYICYVAEQRKIFFLWRPFLKDPKDDMFLELAVEANCDYIITFNKKDFLGIEKFGLKALTPKEFFELLGDIK
ncbi:MAG: putative toxin-antitoxin system toxin component, family [Ignavibacteria bacterium]|nr:putative toxin-antitoxin system toxin component, family [Ignavibacteria bacterium]